MSERSTVSVASLLAVMRRLRDPADGCPWDQKQDFRSIAPYTIEEAYEVADAIDREDFGALKDELGDLLLQTVYHSQMAAERGLFTFDDVVEAIVAKMIRRHPHVFGDGVSEGWEVIKAQERAQSAQHGALDGIARALPALKRAEKIQKRAARVGFDWPDPSGPRAKVIEELGEIDEAVSAKELFAEMGDLLFAAVNLARHHGIDPEAALQGASDKFTRRFEAMEAMAGASFNNLSLDGKEALWQRAKMAGSEAD